MEMSVSVLWLVRSMAGRAVKTSKLLNSVTSSAIYFGVSDVQDALPASIWRTVGGLIVRMSRCPEAK